MLKKSGGFNVVRLKEFEDRCGEVGVGVVAGITELKKPVNLSSRKISLSDGPMAAPTPQEKKLAHKNRDIFRKYLGLKKLIFPLIEIQEDGVLVDPEKLLDNPKLMLEAVKGRDKKGIKRDFAKELGDAIILTDHISRSGYGVAVHAADCAVLLVASPKNNGTIGAIHSGWKGTRLNVVSKSLNAIGGKNDMAKCVVYVGPMVCGNCYEFGKELYEKEFKSQKFSNSWARPHPIDKNKVLFDNRLAILYQLRERGIKKENIIQDMRCTMEDRHFYSVRRDGFENFSSFAVAVGFKV